LQISLDKSKDRIKLADGGNMDNEADKTIDQIKAILGRYRVTQESIAAEAGIDPATLSVLLNGHRKPSTVVLKSLSRWVADHSGEYPMEGVSAC